MTKKGLIRQLVEYGEDYDDLKNMSVYDLRNMLDDIEYTSDFHPNESYDEFMEHECWD